MICFAVSLKVICSFRQWIISIEVMMIHYSIEVIVDQRPLSDTFGAMGHQRQKNALVLQQEHLMF